MVVPLVTYPVAAQLLRNYNTMAEIVRSTSFELQRRGGVSARVADAIYRHSHHLVDVSRLKNVNSLFLYVCTFFLSSLLFSLFFIIFSSS